MTSARIYLFIHFLPVSFSALGANMFASSGNVLTGIILYLHFKKYTDRNLRFSKIRRIRVYSAISRKIFEPIKSLHRSEAIRLLIIFQPAGADACQLFTKNPSAFCVIF
jgi:hypothetical protein